MNWIKTTEQLPEFHKDVMFYTVDGIRIGRLYASSNKFKSDWDVFYLSDVTHWMPMPNPPIT